MRLLKLLSACIALTLGIHDARADDAAMKKELTPTGKLRMAVPVGPSAGVTFATKNAATGQYRGVSIELGKGLAAKLGVPIEFVDYPNSGDVVAAADSGAWDVAFVPVDAERRKALAFAGSYVLSQSTYLVAPGSTIQTVADVNRAGVRIVGVKDTATIRASAQASPNATHTAVSGPAEAAEAMREGKADAIALGRESLISLAPSLPGSRILEGAFLSNSVAAAVPKGKPAALAYVRTFIDEAKASGLVRRALDDLGLKTTSVAPAGMEP
ncbi:MAG: transporter substrate-binding domain-containing protein [Rhodospirillales bacterium]|nr:transporter substrate-binding domain-containing protein [Rhodospirillales bacterium]